MYLSNRARPPRRNIMTTTIWVILAWVILYEILKYDKRD